jgi:hypothetical protein
MLIPKKYHIHIVAIIAISVMLFYPMLSKRIDPQILSAGTMAAEDFLHLVDIGEYEQSWESSSTLMRERIFLEVWSRQIPLMRARVGQLKNRKQESASISDQAEGAPEGSYMTLSYESSFENNSSVMETVNLVLEEDGRWRVIGYFLK